MRTPTGSRWATNKNINCCHWRLESVAVPVGDRMPAEWEPALDRGLGPSVTHGWAAQPECERSAARVRRTWGQYVAVYLRLQLTSHTQPTSTLSRIKCEKYIFIKKCVRSFIEVRHYCFPYIFVYVCGYTTPAYFNWLCRCFKIYFYFSSFKHMVISGIKF